MRGKAAFVAFNIVTIRITPAYAGKRFFIFRSAAVVRDHPRLCGEKCTWQKNQAPPVGSPPPMRGKEYTVGVLSANPRITPAYAGKSDRVIVEKVIFEGSPPPMRGKVP